MSKVKRAPKINMNDIVHIPFLKKSVIFLIILIFILTGIFAYIILNQDKKDVKNQNKMSEDIIHVIQSNISYDMQRQRMIIFCKDEILKVNKNIRIDEAYEIASIFMKYSEIYPNIDPLMLLAIGKNESRFNRYAKSCEGALGLIQVLPINTRHVVKLIGITYSDSLLYNIDFNVRVGVIVLDDAFLQYGKDFKVVMCYYNGGHKQVYNYLNNIPLDVETGSYKNNVYNDYVKYQNMFKGFIVK